MEELGFADVKRLVDGEILFRFVSGNLTNYFRSNSTRPLSGGNHGGIGGEEIWHILCLWFNASAKKDYR